MPGLFALPLIGPGAGILSKAATGLSVLGGGIGLVQGIPYFFDPKVVERDLLKKDEDVNTGERVYNLGDKLRLFTSQYAPNTDEAEEKLDEKRDLVQLNRETKEIERLDRVADAEAKRAARTRTLNPDPLIALKERELAGTEEFNRYRAQNDYNTLRNKYETDRLGLMLEADALKYNQTMGLAELDLRRQMEEQKMQQFRERLEYDRDKRKEERIQLIMDVINGMTRPTIRY
tara:strand:- start:931 stop:1626 length:696 start_codon:yes stop_codon:yes gene_type:complete